MNAGEWSTMLLMCERTDPLGHGGWTYNRLAGAPQSPVWTDPDGPEHRMHRLHSYPARFPAHVVHRALNHARERGIMVQRVADPFCGSGTVPYEAAARGLDFWGCDINPVATLIAQVKCSAPDPARFLDLAGSVMARSASAPHEPDLPPPAIARLRPWFEASQFETLARLRNAIALEVGEAGEDASSLLCAFSAILKGSSLWRARSIKPSRDPSKKFTPALATFERQCRLMASAWTADDVRPLTSAEIVRGDVAHVAGPAEPVDLIVTSPPYATSYEYADLHQLSALWLGYAQDHRELRSGVIGTASRRADLNRALGELNAVGAQVVFSLFDKDRALAEAAATYFLDMQRVARRCRCFLRPGGLAVFVIGNTSSQGVRVDNANHLVESLLDAGFADVRVARRRISNKLNTPYRSPDGRLSSSATETSIYAEEYVLMAQRR